MNQPKLDLMYRRPNRAYHENITEVLDDILKRLETLEKVVYNLDNSTQGELVGPYFQPDR